MSATFITRAIRDTDYPELAALHAACFSKSWDKSDLKEVMTSAGAGGIVATDNDVLVGFVLYRVAADEAEILSIGVRPDYRRHGIARQLLEQMEADVKARGALTCFNEVAVTNNDAVMLYEKTGFTRCGERKGYYAIGGEKVDALMMRKTLS